MAYGAGLLIPFRLRPIEGSNPSASANRNERQQPSSVNYTARR